MVLARLFLRAVEQPDRPAVRKDAHVADVARSQPQTGAKAAVWGVAPFGGRRDAQRLDQSGEGFALLGRGQGVFDLTQIDN